MPVANRKQKNWDAGKDHNWRAQSGKLELITWQRSRRSWVWEVRWRLGPKMFFRMATGSKQKAREAMTAANDWVIVTFDDIMQFIPSNPLE